MFRGIGKRIKNIFSRLIKHSKKDKVISTKLNDCENLMNEEHDILYNKNKECEILPPSQPTTLLPIKDNSGLINECEFNSNLNQFTQITIDSTKNIEKVLYNKIHRKDRHKKNKKYK